MTLGFVFAYFGVGRSPRPRPPGSARRCSARSPSSRSRRSRCSSARAGCSWTRPGARRPEPPTCTTLDRARRRRHDRDLERRGHRADPGRHRVLDRAGRREDGNEDTAVARRCQRRGRRGGRRDRLRARAAASAIPRATRPVGGESASARAVYALRRPRGGRVTEEPASACTLRSSRIVFVLFVDHHRRALGADRPAGARRRSSSGSARYIRTLDPGLHVLVPFVDTLRAAGRHARAGRARSRRSR